MLQFSSDRETGRINTDSQKMTATQKQGFGAATATVGSAIILGWIAVAGATGINRAFLPITGLSLISAGGAFLTAGRIQEQKELKELFPQI